jgi:hypothetical protein
MSALTDIEGSFSGLAVSEEYALAPSKYGMYVSLDCDLYLRRATAKVITRGKTKNAVSERMQKRGSEWEVRICEHLKDACSRTPTEKYTDCTTINFKAFLDQTLTSNTTALVHHLYQATLDPEIGVIPEPLRKAGVTVSRIIPDLLKLQRRSVTSPWELTVIDAKSSLSMKQSHQAQASPQSDSLTLYLLPQRVTILVALTFVTYGRWRSTHSSWSAFSHHTSALAS